MGKLDGKVAFITGAARGQGRCHAIRMAEEGADIIAVDICAQIDSVLYPLGTKDELNETVRSVESLDRRIVDRIADVRDAQSLQAAFDSGVAALGPVDIVVANAGITPLGEGRQAWQDVIDVNLTGVLNTIDAAIPSMISRGRGGSIVIINSTAGLTGYFGRPSYGALGYTAAKHGLVGLMRFYANDLGRHSIRVNSIHPTGVNTPMATDPALAQWVDANMKKGLSNALPIDMIEPIDVSNAVMYLVSDDGRYVTGVSLPVDAGFIGYR